MSAVVVVFLFGGAGGAVDCVGGCCGAGLSWGG